MGAVLYNAEISEMRLARLLDRTRGQSPRGLLKKHICKKKDVPMEFRRIIRGTQSERWRASQNWLR